MSFIITKVLTATDTTSSKTFEISNSSGSNIPVGTLLYFLLACDNSGSNGSTPTVTLSDDCSNTYSPPLPIPLATRDPGAVNEGISLMGWYPTLTNAITTTSKWTLSFNNDTAAKAVIVYALNSTDSNYRIRRRASLSGLNGTGTAPTSTRNIPLGDMMLGMIGLESYSTATDSDTTNGSWSSVDSAVANISNNHDSSISLSVQYKIPSSAGNQTYNPTFGDDNRDYVLAWMQFYEYEYVKSVASTLTTSLSISAALTLEKALTEHFASTSLTNTLTASASAIINKSVSSSITSTLTASASGLVTKLGIINSGNSLSIGASATITKFIFSSIIETLSPLASGLISRFATAESSLTLSEQALGLVTKFSSVKDETALTTSANGVITKFISTDIGSSLNIVAKAETDTPFETVFGHISLTETLSINTIGIVTKHSSISDITSLDTKSIINRVTYSKAEIENSLTIIAKAGIEYDTSVAIISVLSQAASATVYKHSEASIASSLFIQAKGIATLFVGASSTTTATPEGIAFIEINGIRYAEGSVDLSLAIEAQPTRIIYASVSHKSNLYTGEFTLITASITDTLTLRAKLRNASLNEFKALVSYLERSPTFNVKDRQAILSGVESNVQLSYAEIMPIMLMKQRIPNVEVR